MSRIDAGQCWFADTVGAKIVRLWLEEGEYRVTCDNGEENLWTAHQDFGEALATVALHTGTLL